MKFLQKLFGKQAACEACGRHMIKLDASSAFGAQGGVRLTPQELLAGNVGVAEECVECGRRYCDRCYPSRPKNSCVCGKGRTKVEERDGVRFTGSMRLVKVQYTD